MDTYVHLNKNYPRSTFPSLSLLLYSPFPKVSLERKRSRELFHFVLTEGVIKVELDIFSCRRKRLFKDCFLPWTRVGGKPEIFCPLPFPIRLCTYV